MGYKRSVHRTFALITQLGLSMLAPIFLCTFLGVYLEDRFSLPVFIPLLILGILAGGRNTYMLAKRANEDKEDKEQ
ncbi:AtpZ/AtpI family protein [Lachnospiraceae bacterium LCP25S3_G4]